MHGRSRMTIDPRTSTMPGRRYVGFSPTRQTGGGGGDVVDALGWQAGAGRGEGLEQLRSMFFCIYINQLFFTRFAAP